MTDQTPTAPTVGLLVTCLVDVTRPSVGFAAVDLLERAGCTVVVPERQTCCGQPAFNAGDRDAARRLAHDLIAAFRDVDYVVAPSGSCAAMLRCHYPDLLATDRDWARQVGDWASRVWELTAFLVDVMGFTGIDAAYPYQVTYHDSCSGLRELDIRAQPRALLGRVVGLDLLENDDPDSCCGFGGGFMVRHAELSARIAATKGAALRRTRANTVLGGDLGCLINLAGRLHREGSGLQVRHVAEVLAGRLDEPPIGAVPEAPDVPSEADPSAGQPAAREG